MPKIHESLEEILMVWDREHKPQCFEDYVEREHLKTCLENGSAIKRKFDRFDKRLAREYWRGQRIESFLLRGAIILCFVLVVIYVAAVSIAFGASDDKPTTGGLIATQAQETAFTEAEIIEPQLVSLGQFRITHYCACEKCCGKTDGITATGTKATEGRTIAVDPDVIPYGSEVALFYDDGRICYYVAEDCGGAIKGNDIDVFVDSHEEALELGVTGASVYLVNEVKG